MLRAIYWLYFQGLITFTLKGLLAIDTPDDIKYSYTHLQLTLRAFQFSETNMICFSLFEVFSKGKLFKDSLTYDRRFVKFNLTTWQRIWLKACKLHLLMCLGTSNIS